MFKDPQLWIAVLAVLVASYSAYFQRKQYLMMLPAPGKRGGIKKPLKPWWQYPPLIATFVLALLAWAPLVFSSNQPMTPTVGVAGWGTQDMSVGLPITVAISKDDPSAKLMGVAYHYDGSTDISDVDHLQKSALYDVRVGAFIIMIKPDETFLQEVTSHRHVRTNYMLLEVPASLNKLEFSTLRQAAAMGVKTIWAGVGPP